MGTAFGGALVTIHRAGAVQNVMASIAQVQRFKSWYMIAP